MRHKSLALMAALILLGSTSAVFAQGRQWPYPEGSIFLQKPAPAPSMVPHGGTATDRSAHLSPLDPLDAPDAGNVWKPSNRDAGNLAAERWAAYDEQRRQNLAAVPTPPRVAKVDPAHRYPSYDSFDEFFANVFH